MEWLCLLCGKKVVKTIVELEDINWICQEEGCGGQLIFPDFYK